MRLDTHSTPQTTTPLESARFDTQWTDSYPWTQDALHALARIFERPLCTWANRAARVVLKQLSVRSLSRNARKCTVLGANPVRFEARHSVLNRSEFVLFQSDIDLAAVFKRPPNEDALKALEAILSKTRLYVPALGELEIYTDAEWKTRSRIRNLAPMAALIQTLWDFRKMYWLENSLQPWLHPYHAAKKERALAICWKKLGEAPSRTPARRRHLGPGFQSHLKQVFSALQFPPVQTPEPTPDIYCKYLQCEFQSGAATGESSASLNLPLELWVPLLSVLPPAQDLPEALRSSVEAYRRHPAVLNARSLVLLHEWVVVKSRQRTHPATARANESWLAALRRGLQTAAPICWDFVESIDLAPPPNSNQKQHPISR
jgi:hypothetical protein